MDTSGVVPLPIGPHEQRKTLAFTLDRDLPAGVGLRVKALNLRALFHAYIESVRIDGRPMPVASRFDWAAYRGDFKGVLWHFEGATVQLDRAWSAGTRVEATVRVAGFETPPDGPHRPNVPQAEHRPPEPLAGLVFDFALHTADKLDAPHDAWRQASRPAGLLLTPDVPARLEAWRLSSVELAVQHFDRYTNPVAPDVDAVEVDGVTTLLEQAVGFTRLTCDASADRMTVRDARGRTAVSTPTPLGVTGEPIYFGEFHWHTEISPDGVRSLDDALRSARDELGLHFAGPADHLFWGNSYSRGFTVEHQRDICLKHERPGAFITLPTFELSGPEGHANVIADSWDLLIEIASESGAASSKAPKHRYPLHELASLCPPGRAMLVPHHTNMNSHVKEGVVSPENGRPFWNNFDWRLPAPEAVRLMEVVQLRGSFEAEATSEAWLIDVGGYGSSARSALMKGFRIGFTGGTDNHQGWPTRGTSAWCGLTGVHAPTLTLAEIFRGLYERRTFATTGARLVADFRVQGRAIGSVVAWPPGAPRMFDVLVRGTAPLAQVQVIHCGEVLADLPVEEGQQEVRATWADDRPGRPLECCYYLRARQRDGHCLWVSPTWIELP